MITFFHRVCGLQLNMRGKLIRCSGPDARTGGVGRKGKKELDSWELHYNAASGQPGTTGACRLASSGARANAAEAEVLPREARCQRKRRDRSKSGAGPLWNTPRKKLRT